MALIKLGTLVVGIRGTMGGATFSANRAGTYAKAWNRPPISQTNAQQDQVGAWSNLNFEWAQLSSAEQSAWDTYAADPAQELTNSLGETYFATGQNWFIRINSHLIRSGRTIRSAPPSEPLPTLPGDEFLQFVLVSGDLEIIQWRSPSNGFATDKDYPVFVTYAPVTSQIVAPNTGILLKPGTTPLTGGQRFQVQFDNQWGAPITAYRIYSTIYAQGTQGRRGESTTSFNDVPAYNNWNP